MAEPLLGIVSEEDGAVAVLRLLGEVDHWTSIELSRAFERIAHSGRTRVVLDLQHVRFMDGGGLSALTMAQRSGLTVTLRDVPAGVQRLLD